MKTSPPQDPRWDRAKELAGEALELDGSERERLVHDACGTDSALRALVRELLASADAAHDFLERPAIVQDDLTLPPGTLVGPYTIESQIGEGGFAEVYRAKQTAPVERTVAIKLLKLGMDTKQVLARFALERQTLARLDHRNIARWFDAGLGPMGRSFVAMEFVDGSTITHHAQRHGLDFRARANLCQEVCAAVQHAHERGVIHRDLKPSNMLVEVGRGEACVKVIDFGIAKILAHTDQRTALTLEGLVIGTPAYASPEQLRGDGAGDGVDVRSDIYALGMVFTELFAGVPHPREFDWICKRCCAPDRAERYPSAQALADDLARALAGDAVTAGPPSRIYLLRKFVRRHRLAIAVGVLIFASIATGAGMAVAAASREAKARLAADEARDVALNNQREAEALSKVLGSMMATARTDQGGKDARLSDVLTGADRFLANLADHPLAEARLRDVIGQTWTTLGRYVEADEQFQTALVRLDAVSTADPWLRIGIEYSLCALRYREGRLDEGEALAAKITTAAAAARGANHPLIRQLHDLRAKSAFERGRRDLAVTALMELIALDDAEGRHDHADTARSNVSQVLLSLGRLDEAETIAQRALDAVRERHGDDHHLTIQIARKRAAVHLARREHQELVTVLEPLHVRAVRVLGAEHPDSLGIANYLATGWYRLGRLEDAERLLRATMVDQERRLGPDHAQSMMLLSTLGGVLEARGDFAGAEPFYREAMTRFTRVRGAGGNDTLVNAIHLARVVSRQGRHEEIADDYERWMTELAKLRGGAAPNADRSDFAHHRLALGRERIAAGRLEPGIASLRLAEAEFRAVGAIEQAESAAAAIIEAERLLR
ncbi:MAG: protein kinase [Planctomycetota bacterium]